MSAQHTPWHLTDEEAAMLEALKAVLAECDGPDRYSLDSYLPAHLVDKVRAAIAQVAGATS